MEFKNREIIETNFVFSLWKEPKLYSRFINKMQNEDITKFLEFPISSFLYKLGEQMVKNGIVSFDEATILSYLSKNSLLKEKFESYDGYNLFRIITKKLDISNVNSYFTEIIKMNLLNKLQSEGFSVEQDYPKLQNASPQEIVAYYSYKLNNSFIENGGDTRIENFQITKDDFADFNSGTEMGLSIASTAPLLNYEILGLNRGLTFIGGHVNQGKAQPLTSKIMTPYGWKELGELKVGDEIVGLDNEGDRLTNFKIEGYYPKGKLRAYELLFSDGSRTQCNDEHLWTLYDEGGQPHTEELKWFMERMKEGHTYALPQRVNLETLRVAELRNPVSIDGLKYKYDCFVLGYLLGDRAHINKKENKCLCEFAIQKHQVNVFRGLGVTDLSYYKSYGDSVYNGLEIDLPMELWYWLQGVGDLGAFPLVTYKNVKNNREYTAISSRCYTMLSYFDRRKMLLGYLASNMDLGSSLEESVKVHTYNIPLLESMIQLAHSMGYYTKRLSEHEAIFSFVSLGRVELLQVTDTHEDVEMACIYINSRFHLYVTDDFIYTHNTSFSLAVIVKAWLNEGIKCCIISNEQTLKEFKQLLIAMVSYELYGENTLNRRRLKVGHFNSSESKMFDAIADKINRDYAPNIKFAKIFNYSIDEVKMVIETLSTQGYSGFIYDVFKADDSASTKVIGEMKEMSKELFRVADKTNSSIVATVQLGLSDIGVRFLTLGNISTSKHITEPATEVLLLRAMWEDEITGGKYDIRIQTPTFDSHGNLMKDKNGKTIMKNVQVGEDDYKKIKIIFLAKTRNTEQGKALAYKFDGLHNQWIELGYCSPSFENRGGYRS